MIVADERDTRLVEIEYREVSAFGGDVDPTESGIQAQDIRPGAGPRDRDRVAAAELDARKLVIVLAGDERALAVGMQAQPVRAGATGQIDPRRHGLRLRIDLDELVGRIRA